MSEQMEIDGGYVWPWPANLWAPHELLLRARFSGMKKEENYKNDPSRNSGNALWRKQPGL
jgi:hypothetical protein